MLITDSSEIERMKGSMNIFFVVVVALLQSRRIMVQQLDNYVQCKWQLESASELIERGIFFCCAAAEPRKCEEATTRRRRRRVRKASQKDSKVSVAFGERRNACLAESDGSKIFSLENESSALKKNVAADFLASEAIMTRERTSICLYVHHLSLYRSLLYVPT